jgi:Tfp pilus assembly protein PilV
MKTPLAIVLIAVVLLAVSTLAIMNQACKSSQHEWCAPSTIWHHRAQLSSDD